MSDLRVIQRDRNCLPTHDKSPGAFQQADDVQFGLPPSLLVGVITGIVGASAGIVSLLLFFSIWEPELYISQQWLIFVFAGAVVGFFLRLERAYEEAVTLSCNRVPKGQ